MVSAFPGLFSYESIRSLDYRDLTMFYREAQRKEMEKTLNLMSSYRASMAKTEEYKKVVSELKHKMNQIQVGSRETIRTNWDALKRGG